MGIYSIKITKYGYDSYNAHIIVANNEKEVIELAQSVADYEGKKIWMEAEIEKVGVYTAYNESEPFILLSSYNAG